MGDLDRCYRRPGAFQSYGAPVSCVRRLEIVNRSSLTSPPPSRRQIGGNISSSDGGVTVSFGDPELKRRRRVAAYNAYTVEGKVKTSIGKGIRWIKGKCADLAHVF